MNLLVKSPVWDDLREIGLRIAAENLGKPLHKARDLKVSFLPTV